ncbi:MAG: hypothetical protein HC850_15360 [Rhodomicrobium sp.]|nr:hypothetical protein [Rhodomicrobium sp.]
MKVAFKPVLAAVSAILLAMMMAGGAFAAESAPNDAARFLAGLKPADGTPLAKRAEEAVWQRHAKFFDSSWEKLEARQLSKIRTWQGKHLTAPQQTLYYMFSGPDFLYANAFFPKATTYILSGLEPVGVVPELSDMPGGTLQSEFRDLQVSLNSVLNYSFFITKNMKSQLRSGKVNGTLPVIYVFLARSGKTIDEVSFVELDEEGNVGPAPESGSKSAAKGMKIGFTDAEGKKQTLYYFTTDLSNGGVKKSGFLKFCEKQAPGHAFIKSASYLLHSGGFSTVRDFLLAKSTAILQDDSGIPVTYFKDEEWDLKPFGRYLGPISLFRGNYQSKLAKLFKQPSRESIDFGFGYRWRPNESNILLSVKKQPKAASAQ